MKNKLIAIILCICLICGLTGCSSQQNKAAGKVSGKTITVTDHNGNVVTLPKDIERIVCTDIYPLPSVLSVFLGSAKKIVGIHPTSMSAAKSGTLGELFPEILKADTSFMQGTNLNIEKLLMLKPDIVFYNAANEALGENIRKAGLAAVAVAVNKWDYNILETYNQWISLLSQIFPGNDKSEEISKYNKEMYDLVQSRVSGIADKDKKRIFFLFQYDGSRIVTSGCNFFGQFWSEAVGGKNAAQEITAENSNAVVNMEQIYKWAPDIVFITNFTSAQPKDLYNNTIGTYDWSQIPAVKNSQVFKMPLGVYRSYTPSTDTPVTLLWMAKTVYPELFKDIDISKKVKDYYMKLYGVELTDKQVQKMFHPESGYAQDQL